MSANSNQNDETPEAPGLPIGVPIDPFALPLAHQEGLRYVSEQLEAAKCDCTSATDSVCEACQDEIQVASTDVATILRTHLGQVGIALDDASALIQKQSDTVIKDVSVSLYHVAMEAERAGVVYPFDHDVRTMLLASDPADWLPVVVPTFQAALAGAARVEDTGTGTGTGTGNGTGGFVGDMPCGPANCYYDDLGNYICPECPPPPPPPPPPPVPCPDGSFLPPGSDPRFCPTNDGEGDGGDGDTDTDGDGDGGGTCPTPVCCPDNNTNITVNTGGTLILNDGGGSGGSPPPPPPPPPTTCNEDVPDVNVENKVVVNVPPDPILKGPGTPSDLVKSLRDKYNPTDWRTSGPCSLLPEYIKDWDKQHGALSPTNDPGQVGPPSFFSRIAAPFRAVINSESANTTEAIGKVASAVIGTPATLAEGAWSAVYDLFDALDPKVIQHLGTAKYLGGRLGMATWCQRITGFPAEYLFQGELYSYQYANPQYLPTQPSVDSLYLRGRIDEEAWTCYTRALGNIPDIARDVRNISQAQPDYNQIVQLYLRKELTPVEFYDRMRKIGFVEPDHTNEILTLATQLPTQSDLLRMMVRDAAREDIVEKYKYDTDFDKVFVGKLRDWSEAQGVPAEVFKFFWRSHWVIPSNTQLYEMGQRFRPDRPEVENWDSIAALIGIPAATAQLGPRPYVVTQEDIRQALQVNDQAPSWIPGLIGISYNPMTRTDAVRAFEIGAISDVDLYHRMRDVGYNEADARTLVDFYVQQANRRASNATGVLTIRKIVKLYKGYAMTRGDAEGELKRLIKEDTRVAALLDGAERERVYEHQAKMIGILKKRFMTGLVSDQDIGIDLGGAGVQPIDQAALLRRWSDEKRSVDKAPTAAQLCKWFKLRLITVDEYRARLVGMNYTADDVVRIMADCVGKK